MPRQPTIPDLMDMVKELRREVKLLRTATPLQSAAVGQGGLVFYDEGQARSDDFDPGVAGWRLGGDSAEFNNLTLRGGIIGNDALAEPVKVSGSSFIQNVFATTTTDVAYAAASIPVPSGFTQALVMTTVYVGAVNSTAAFDYLYVQARINGVDSREVPFGANPAGFAGATTAKSTLLTGLVDGDTIDVAAAAHTGTAGWAANASNRAASETIVIFLR